MCILNHIVSVTDQDHDQKSVGTGRVLQSEKDGRKQDDLIKWNMGGQLKSGQVV